jgi:5-(carboxyamino)imidazole ribonucleotide mutase
MPHVSIILGSSSDEQIMRNTTKILDELKLSYEIKVISAHRLPEVLVKYISNLDAKVVIAIP